MGAGEWFGWGVGGFLWGRVIGGGGFWGGVLFFVGYPGVFFSSVSQDPLSLLSPSYHRLFETTRLAELGIFLFSPIGWRDA